MSPEEIASYIKKSFKGMKPKDKWGETSFFYNPGDKLPHGVYFATIKQKDGENNEASNLSRERVFQLNFGISENSFLKLFSEKPKRPSREQIINGDYDFKALNVVSPHPVYGWQDL